MDTELMMLNQAFDAQCELLRIQGKQDKIIEIRTAYHNRFLPKLKELEYQANRVKKKHYVDETGHIQFTYVEDKGDHNGDV